jgi:competence protein ComEA
LLQRGGLLLAGVLIGLLTSGLLLVLIAEPRGEPARLHPPPTPRPVRVHVAGAVRQPGVYELPQGAVVAQAIEAAGGGRPEADLEAVNLAAPLADGQQVFVPRRAADAALEPGSQAGSTPRSVLLNINTATASELEDLPGIGPVLAERIVAYRQEHGPFQKVEDLLRVPGIGPAKLADIEGLVTVR